MKTIKSIIAFLILTISTLVLVGWYPDKTKSDIDLEQNIIVLLKFKAQKDQGFHAISELSNLLEKVKEEPNFVSIKLHIDPNDNTNILLYEEWKDESYYNNEHMSTTHLKEFMVNSRNFLTGPPEITFWKIKNVYE